MTVMLVFASRLIYPVRLGTKDPVVLRLGYPLRSCKLAIAESVLPATIDPAEIQL